MSLLWGTHSPERNSQAVLSVNYVTDKADADLGNNISVYSSVKLVLCCNVTRANIQSLSFQSCNVSEIENHKHPLHFCFLYKSLQPDILSTLYHIISADQLDFHQQMKMSEHDS